MMTGVRQKSENTQIHRRMNTVMPREKIKFALRIITASRNGRIPPPRGDSAVFLTPGGHQCDTPRRNHSKKELNTEKEKKFIAAFSLYLYIR
jgi:hypothetical protein